MLPEDKPLFVLDIGCVSDPSGEILEKEGHVWADIDTLSILVGTSSRPHVLGSLRRLNGDLCRDCAGARRGGKLCFLGRLVVAICCSRTHLHLIYVIYPMFYM